MLEWKAFTRSASFGTNLVLKIFMILGAIYFSVMFLILGAAVFYILKDELKLDPIQTVSKYLIYYCIIDLIIRLLLQKIPVLNIRPLLVLPIKKPTIVNFSLGKTYLSFFNLLHLFFFMPFTVVLLIEGYDVASVLIWHFSVFCLIFSNNFIGILLNNKDNLFFIFIGLVVAFAACQYYNVFDVTVYTAVFYQGLFDTKWVFLIPVGLLIGLFYITFHYFKSELYLDAGLASKHEIAKTENLTWLNQFGTVGTFLKNDIKLIKRNKRSKTTVIMSVLFLFYGMLFFSSGIEAYDNPFMHMFAGIFVTGGFLFTFGQFVPSWDSSYYPLMMTQNIPYKGYLSSKWWLVVIATVISSLLSAFYLYFGWEVYLTILVGAVYNIGVNSHLVLLGGAYTKTPVDLTSSKGAFGDKKAFNVKTMLISLPKLLLPMLLYGLGTALFNATTGLAFVAVAGVLGFVLRNKVFSLIEKVYKTEKYATLDAYKQKG